MKQPVVISLGGSVLVPKDVDAVFLKRFVIFIRRVSRSRRVFLVSGGGDTARRYVHAARMAGIRKTEDLHWIGVRSCQLNSAILRAAFGLSGALLIDRANLKTATGRIVVIAPSAAGATSDYGSVLAAHAVGAKTIYNLTNVAGVYTADPRQVRSATLLPALTWRVFNRMFETGLKPGMHVPFDPMASRLAARFGIRVVVLSADLQNLEKAISDKRFLGTIIGSA